MIYNYSTALCPWFHCVEFTVHDTCFVSWVKCQLELIEPPERNDLSIVEPPESLGECSSSNIPCTPSAIHVYLCTWWYKLSSNYNSRILTLPLPHATFPYKNNSFLSSLPLTQEVWFMPYPHSIVVQPLSAHLAKAEATLVATINPRAAWPQPI